MKLNIIKLKKIFASDYFVIIALVILNLALFNCYLGLVSLIYLIIFKDYKAAIVFIILIVLIYLRLGLNNHIYNYYYVNKVNSTHVIANSLFNSIKIYEADNLSYGDLIQINVKEVEYLEDINDQKKGIYYKVTDYKLNSKQSIKSFRANLYAKIKDNDNPYKAMLNKDLFNVYSDNYNDKYLLINISWNIFYISLIEFLKRLFKNEYAVVALVSLCLFIVVGINYSTLRIFILELLNLTKLQRSISLAIAAYIMVLIRPMSIYSYSFILPFLIRLNFRIASSLKFRSLLMLMQSYFFGEVNLLINLLFRPLSTLKAISTLIISLMYSFNLAPTSNALGPYLKEIFEYIDAFSIRGQINIIFILMIIYIFRHFSIKNAFLQVMIISLVLCSNISNALMKVSFIDVRQGDAILIKTSFNDETILIDTGSSFNYYLLKRYLINEGIYSIDKLVISHGDADHYGNLKNLAKDFRIKEYVFEHGDIETERLKLISLNESKYKSKNDNGLVHYTELDGLKFLFMADVGVQVEEDIFKDRYLNVDVLKLGHHGSATSTGDLILANTNPKFGIISTNGTYGHPSPKVIKRIEDYGLTYFSTKDKSDIEFIFTSFLKIIKCSKGDFVIIVE